MTHIHFDPAILLADPARRQRILPVLEAALHAVDPGPAVSHALQRAGPTQTNVNDLIAVFVF
jgi:glycerate-2-kinase